MSICADFLVELRGFEPLTSAVQAPVRLTGSSRPFLGGSSATAGAGLTSLPTNAGTAGAHLNSLPR